MTSLTLRMKSKPSLWSTRSVVHIVWPRPALQLTYYFSSLCSLGPKHATPLVFSELPKGSSTSETLLLLLPLPGMPFPKPSHVPHPLLQVSGFPLQDLLYLKLFSGTSQHSLVFFPSILCGETVSFHISPARLLPRN